MNRKFISAALLLFVMMFSFTSCKKDKADVEQENRDLAESAAGTYNVSYLKYNDNEGNLPSNGVSGKVAIAKSGEDQASMKLTLTNANSTEPPGEADFGNVDLKKESSAIALYLGTDKIGTISGDDLNISITGGQGELIIRAKK